MSGPKQPQNIFSYQAHYTLNQVILSPWVVSFAYFLQAAGQDPGPPDFVYWILITQLLLFQSFAFNMLLQYLRIGPWRDYLFGERMYQILSLVAKTILAWLVFGGLFQPE